MKLLHVITSLNPAHGGTVESIRGGCQELIAQGHSVEVVTCDALNAEWFDRIPAKVTGLGEHGPADGFGYCKRLIPWLKQNQSRFDAAILHEPWRYACLGGWQGLRGGKTPYFVYAHGSLDPWFEQMRLKHLKKTLYWRVWGNGIFRDARGILFTCEQERDLARRSFRPYVCRELVSPLGISAPAIETDYAAHFLTMYPHLKGKRLLLFLSRVHVKKGVDLLISAFAAVAFKYPDLHLVIAGPDEEGYGSSLRSLAQTLKISDRITWTGLLTKPELRFGSLRAAEAFVLPSHSENFGYAVVEALARAVPVLISTKINIWKEIVEDGAGLAEADELEGTKRLLARWLSLSHFEKERMRDNARACFEKRFEIAAAIRSLVETLNSSQLPVARLTR